MPSLEISITAPFEVGDLVASLELEDGTSTDVVLRNGRFRGDLGARPKRLRLTTNAPPPGESDLRFTRGDRDSHPKGTAVSLHELFDEGVDLTGKSSVDLQLLWGAPCHTEELPDAVSSKRFASWEHLLCAAYVGLDEASDEARPLEIGGAVAPFAHDTELPMGRGTLTFGEIICLAGDFYAHLDRETARGFSWAWPPMSGVSGWVAGDYREMTLAEDDPGTIEKLLTIIARDKDVDRGAAGEFATAAIDAAKNDYPARRYLALASQNYCHFATPAPGGGEESNEALRLYRAYHLRALERARAAKGETVGEPGLLEALAIDAFGCHFLTDLFASGHIRVPRRILGERYGVTIGALHMSHAMHAEDNRLGLWVTPRGDEAGPGRTVWRAYGDGMLRRDESKIHFRQVQEAVRRSAAEIFAAYSGFPSLDKDLAESILPVPLPPGEAPGALDNLPDGRRPPAVPTPNHWPLYWFRDDGEVVKRHGAPHENRYAPVFAVLGGASPLPSEAFA